jgi:biotin carboxylase/acetyl-CoA carboxylase carboxyltransferase component/biotin carboxyl carrier protein
MPSVEENQIQILHLLSWLSAMEPRDFDSVEAYVKELGGDRPIKKVLIANNGIGAVKAMRSVRRWAYEMFKNERAIKFVCMATPDDLNANAEFTRLADEIVEVPGGSNNNNYANPHLIIDIAERWNVDAVWPGWGHASENDLLPDNLAKTKNNIVFIGPSGAPMRALGDKIGSTIIAQSAGVPTIGWNGDGVKMNYKELGTVPPEIYKKGQIFTAEECTAAATRIGFPVMIKASEGGGGKGIRLVASADLVPAAFRQVQSELPGSPIFVMKLAPESRHLEVQLLADKYGEAIALSGRDCSIQRRHQKIIEEGPQTAAGPETWEKMMAAAVRLAKEVDYCNAGTVEYLYNPATDGFYFLELNPRLQVEHPVTEMITNVNLPAAQFQVAMGIPLNRIPDIRSRFGAGRFDTAPLDLSTAKQKPPHGHVIAARITAENPDAGFQPTSGQIQELNFRSTPDVWGYFSLDSHGHVHEFADSQIGHVFAWGPNRKMAIKHAVMALKELSLRGDIRTTVEYIVNLMENSDFQNNKISTMWLDERLSRHKEIKAETQLAPELVVHVGAVVQASMELEKRRQEHNGFMERGQLPPSELLKSDVGVELIYDDVKYALVASQTGTRTFALECNGASQEVDVRLVNDGGYLVLLNGQSHHAYLSAQPSGRRLQINGQTCLFPDEYDPTRICANAAGKLVHFLVGDGVHVEKGAPYAEIEVMKMLMPLLAPEAGTLHHVKPEGAVLSPGDLLATLELDDASCVTKAELYQGTLAKNDGEAQHTPKPNTLLSQAMDTLLKSMRGFQISATQQEKAVEDIRAALASPSLPMHEFEEPLFVLGGRIPLALFDALSKKTAAWAASNSSEAFDVNPSRELIMKMADGSDGFWDSEKEQAAFTTTAAPLIAVTENYIDGIEGRELVIIKQLLQEYLAAERHFVGRSREEVYEELRVLHKEDLGMVFDIMRSHHLIKQKNHLLLLLLKHIVNRLDDKEEELISGKSGGLGKYAGALRAGYEPLLNEISSLVGLCYAAAAQPARQLITRMHQPSARAAKSKVLEMMKGVMMSGPVGSPARVQLLAEASNAPRDDIVSLGKDVMLHDFLQDETPELRGVAMEGYVRRLYRAYKIQDVQVHLPNKDGTGLMGVHFTFKGEDDGPSMGIRQDSYNDLAALSGGASSPRTPPIAPAETAEDEGNDDSDAEEELIPPTVERQGISIVFATVDEMKAKFEEALLVLPLAKKGPPAASGGLRRMGAPKLAAVNANSSEPVNVAHIAISQHSMSHSEEQQCVRMLTTFLDTQRELLLLHGVRRLTFAFAAASQVKDPNPFSASYPAMYTFRHRIQFREDQLVRHIEAPLAFQLELRRLHNFDVKLVPTGTKNVHLYRALPKQSKLPGGAKGNFRNVHRYFVRSNTRAQTQDESTWMHASFLEALSALEMAMGADQNAGDVAARNNNMYLNIVPITEVSLEKLESVIKQMIDKYTPDILRLKVSQIECKVNANFSKDLPDKISIRFVTSNPTGFVLRVEAYVEVKDGDGKSLLSAIGDQSINELDGQPVSRPYPVVDKFDKNREYAAASTDTLYCFDFLELFESALQDHWSAFSATRAAVGVSTPMPKRNAYMDVSELVLVPFAPAASGGGTSGSAKANAAPSVESRMGQSWKIDAHGNAPVELVEMKRPAGQNDIGMVAWVMKLRTPEYTEGRDIVVIANDITFKAGSFGQREDLLFKKASEYARARRIPRIYLAANSGARIGLAEEVKARFQVCWNQEDDPSKGYKYVYLSTADYNELQAMSDEGAVVHAERINEGGEERWVIKDIIGANEDLGVENLRGSGMIAGETSLAYDQTFTATVVTGRTVGIGAYLVRLGQRCIQKDDGAPIILTGSTALNKLMGRNVYTSNNQIGGVKIMHSNGISHFTATDHMQSVKMLLEWLAFVPEKKGAPLPIADISGIDSCERKISYTPPKGQAYDPRFLLTGMSAAVARAEGFTVDPAADGFLPGFFDRGSWVECLAGWAKTVVVGRARLGGIPMGVIATELRTVEQVTPADPAAPNSEERVVQQAGQVWFPDSAHKTAQSMKDFNREGLPLIVFANWRGFSGGQRDMFDEVLKFGALIVDALVEYKQPVFVYIPPFSELRGGAWVVIDPTINPEQMEMYAAPEGRGGVLEPAGTTSVKFRKKDLLKTAHRLDPELRRLDLALVEAHTSAEKVAGDAAVEARKSLSEIQVQMRAREETLMNVYQQVAEHFADMHDTPGRMAAKGVIRQVVPWQDARTTFYWRLRRRLAVDGCCKRIIEASGGTRTLTEARVLLKSWFAESVDGSAAADSSPGKAQASSASATSGLTAQLLRVVGKSASKGAKGTAGSIETQWNDDNGVVAWVEETGQTKLEQNLKRIQQQRVSSEVMTLGVEDSDAAVQGILAMLEKLEGAKKDEAIKALRRGVIPYGV